MSDEKRISKQEFYQRVKSTNSHLNNIQQEHNIFKGMNYSIRETITSEIKPQQI